MSAQSLRTLVLGLAGLLVAPSLLAQDGDEAPESAESDADSGAEPPDQADSDDAAPRKKSKKDDDEAAKETDDGDFGHGGQFALRAALVAGYRMVLRYDDSPYCRAYDPSKSFDDQAQFCGHGAPLAIDLGLSFAPLDFIEPFVWARFGLGEETETQTDPVVIVGAGARIYTMSDSSFKIYVEPAVGLELEKGIVTDVGYDQDFVFHLAAGPQFDLSKNVGLFVDGGLTVGILRSLHSSLEVKAGVQARLP